jgi:hypothetical protein
VGKQTGAEYDTICGMTAGQNSANACGDTDTGVAGIGMGSCTSTSAVYAAINSGLCSAANPCVVYVGPGVYNECVHIDNVTGLTLRGAGIDQTIIRPTVTAATDVENGVVRIGALTTTRASTSNILLTDFTAQNDAFSAPEPAIEVGKDAGPGNGNPASWQDVIIDHVKAIGNHDGIQWFGSMLTTDKALPRIRLRNSVVIGGDAVAAKGYTIASVQNVDVTSDTAYCVSTDTAHLVQSSGTVAAGTSGTSFTLPATETSPAAAPSAVNDFYTGRKITVDGTDAWITDYVGSTRVVTVTPNLGFTPTGASTYVITAMKHRDGTDYANGDTADTTCTDNPWNIIRGSGLTIQAYWKNSCFHFGIGNSTTPVPDAATLDINGFICNLYIRDFGPQAGTSGCNGQQHMTQLLAYSSAWQDASVTGWVGTSYINTDTIDTNACDYTIAGVALTGDSTFEGALRVSNSLFRIVDRAEPDEAIACIVSKGSQTAALHVSNTTCQITNSSGGSNTVNYLFRDDAKTSTLTKCNIAGDTSSPSGTYTASIGTISSCIAP